ncbi:14079_t:CDS:2, partial [Acaulospora colombiana]
FNAASKTGNEKEEKDDSIFTQGHQNAFDGVRGQRFEVDLENMNNDRTHVPAIKKVLDMHSYQTGIVGAVTEKSINEPVLAPKISDAIAPNEGFPKPVHRSLFRRRKDQEQKENVDITGSSNEVESEVYTHKLSASSQLNKDTRIFESDYWDIDQENNRKIASMSEVEIQETVEMLRKSLSPGFVEKLMKARPLVERVKEGSAAEKNDKDIRVQFKDAEDMECDDDNSMLIRMKEKYFPDVPFEPEKMEWMGVKYNKETTKSSSFTVSTGTSPYAAGPLDPLVASFRFDFSGNIVDKDADVPSYLGLHHHGDDPDQAGYTISELLHLTRSTVPSQRIIPLNVIGRIMKKVRQRVYGEENSDEVANWAMKMKLPVYLRSALDDSFEPVVVAAVDAIAALTIGSHEEEKLWEDSFRLYRGYETVALRRSAVSSKRHFGMDISETDNNDNEPMSTTESHVKLASKDLIAGLISMDTTNRFRYLLEEFHLPKITNEQILLMLIRFSRHSHKSARLILHSPRLLEVVHEKFISLPWPILHTSDEAVQSKFPSLAAAKLIRVLCQSSRNMSIEIMEKYADSFLRYVLVNPASLSDESEMIIGYEFLKETLRIYQTLAAYGLYREIFSRAYSVLNEYFIREILYSLTPPWEWDDSEIYHKQQKLSIAILFFRLLETWTRVQNTRAGGNQKSDAQPSEFIKDSVDLMARWIPSFPTALVPQGGEEIPVDYELALNLMSSIARYVSSWCRHLREHSLKDTGEILRIWEELNMERWHDSTLCYFLRSQMVNLTTQELYSNIWQISNLPGAYHSSTLKHLSRSFSSSVIFDTFLSFISLIRQICELFPQKAFLEKALDVVGSSFSVETLQLCILRSPTKAEWVAFFDRTRSYLLNEWICIFKMLIRDVITGEMKVYYSTKVLQAAFTSMCNIPPGDESIASEMLEYILEEICLSTSDVAWAEEIKESLGSFYNDLIKPIFVIDNQGDAYQQGDKTLMWNYTGDRGGLPLSRGWIWAPIDALYIKNPNLVMDEEVRIEVVRNCLVLVWEVMKICDGFKNPMFSKYVVDPAILMVSIMKVFMMSGELYDVPRIKLWIEKFFAKFSFRQSVADDFTSMVGPSGFPENLSMEKATEEVLKIPFYQFFSDFTGVYAAESSGNKLFAQLIILPLSSIYPTDFKLLVWSDLHDVLGTISIDHWDVLCINSTLVSYFWPLESSTAVLQSFVNAILHDKVTREKTPFLYWMVIHHLNGFVFLEQIDEGKDEDINYHKRLEISKAVVKSARKEVVKDYLMYTSKNFDAEILRLELFAKVVSFLNSEIIALSNPKRAYNLLIGKFFGTLLRTRSFISKLGSTASNEENVRDASIRILQMIDGIFRRGLFHQDHVSEYALPSKSAQEKEHESKVVKNYHDQLFDKLTEEVSGGGGGQKLIVMEIIPLWFGYFIEESRRESGKGHTFPGYPKISQDKSRTLEFNFFWDLWNIIIQPISNSMKASDSKILFSTLADLLSELLSFNVYQAKNDDISVRQRECLKKAVEFLILQATKMKGKADISRSLEILLQIEHDLVKPHVTSIWDFILKDNIEATEESLSLAKRILEIFSKSHEMHHFIDSFCLALKDTEIEAEHVLRNPLFSREFLD